MRALMRLLLGLMLSLSLGMGAVAHAGEAVGEERGGACVETSAHQKDSEPRDSDADKWGLHAHSCHGHHQADAVGRGETIATTPICGLNFAAGEDFLPQLIPGANLRPPIA